MIIIGHKALKSLQFRAIQNIKSIDKTFANEIVFFSNNLALASHCNACEIAYAVEIKNIVDLLIYANLGAKYIVIRHKNLAKKCQKIANEYFLDAKILFVISSDKGIETAAKFGIDGVIYENILRQN